MLASASSAGDEKALPPNGVAAAAAPAVVAAAAAGGPAMDLATAAAAAGAGTAAQSQPLSVAVSVVPPTPGSASAPQPGATPGRAPAPTPAKRPARPMTATDLTPTYNLAFTSVTGYTDNDGNEYKLLEPPLTSVLLEFPDFLQRNVHQSRVVHAQTRDNDWALTLEVVATTKGQQLNATVALVPPEGMAFSATQVRRANPVVELLHRDSVNASAAVNAWKRDDLKVAFGWRSFDAKNEWRQTVEAIAPLKAVADNHLVRGDGVLESNTLVVRFKFNEYERGSVENYRDGGKEKLRLQGYAACTYKNGNQYVGSWVRGRQHGSGEFTHARPFSKYVGQFEDGIRHGRGEFTFSDGTRYAGAWQRGQQHGPGKWFFANDAGSVEGEWADGKLVHGRGQFLNFESGAQYVGEFGPGMKRHGEGTLTALDGTRISGVWANNALASGRGTRALENGGTYSGEMRMEERGKQILLFPNGRGRCDFPQNSGAVTGEWRNAVFVSGHGMRRYRMEVPPLGPVPVTALPATTGGVIDPNALAAVAGAGAAPANIATVTYEGDFAGPDMARHGHGTLRIGEYYYAGEWRNHNFVSGFGCRELREGVYYGGLRGTGGVDVKRDGMGMFLFRYSAQVFIGYWKDDTMFHAGSARYNTGGGFWGYWLAGRSHGCGVFEWPALFRNVTLREYTDGKLISETPSTVPPIELAKFKHSLICSPLPGMSNPIATLFSQPLSVTAARARVDATEFEPLMRRVAAALRVHAGATVGARKLAITRVVRAGAFGCNTLVNPNPVVEMVAIMPDFHVSHWDSYVGVIADRLEPEFPARVFRSRLFVTVPLSGGAAGEPHCTLMISPGGALAPDTAPAHFLALTPPHREFWSASGAALMSALIRPLTGAASNQLLPLYAHLIRVVKVWAAAMPFSADSEPSPLLLELMCLQVCGGAARGVPIEARAAGAGAMAPKSFHIRAASGSGAAGGAAGGAVSGDLNAAFRLFLQLCVQLDTQRVFWDSYFGRKQIPAFYTDRRDERARSEAAAAMSTYEAASTIVNTTDTAAGVIGGAVSAAAAASAGGAAAAAAASVGERKRRSDADEQPAPSTAAASAPVTAPLNGTVVYLHPVNPTLNVAENLTDCAPLKHYALFSLALLEVFDAPDVPAERGVGVYDEAADWAQQQALAAAAAKAQADADAQSAAAAARAAAARAEAKVAAAAAAAAAELAATGSVSVVPAPAKPAAVRDAAPTAEVLITAPTTRDDPYTDPSPLPASVLMTFAFDANGNTVAVPQTQAQPTPQPAPQPTHSQAAAMDVKQSEPAVAAAAPALPAAAPEVVSPPTHLAAAAPAGVQSPAPTAPTATPAPSASPAPTAAAKQPVLAGAKNFFTSLFGKDKEKDKDKDKEKAEREQREREAKQAKEAKHAKDTADREAAERAAAEQKAAAEKAAAAAAAAAAEKAAAEQRERERVAAEQKAAADKAAADKAAAEQQQKAAAEKAAAEQKAAADKAAADKAAADKAAAAAAAAAAQHKAVPATPAPAGTTAAVATPAAPYPAQPPAKQQPPQYATPQPQPTSLAGVSLSNPFGNPFDPAPAAAAGTSGTAPSLLAGQSSSLDSWLSAKPGHARADSTFDAMRQNAGPAAAAAAGTAAAAKQPEPAKAADASKPAAAAAPAAAPVVSGPQCPVCKLGVRASDRAVMECMQCERNLVHRTCAVPLDAVNRDIRFCSQTCRSDYVAEHNDSPKALPAPAPAAATKPAAAPAAVALPPAATAAPQQPQQPQQQNGLKAGVPVGAQPTPFAMANGHAKPVAAPAPTPVPTPAAAPVASATPVAAPTKVVSAPAAAPAPAAAAAPAAAPTAVATPAVPAPAPVYVMPFVAVPSAAPNASGPRVLPTPPPRPAYPNCRVCAKAMGESDRDGKSKKFTMCCNCTATIHARCGVPDDDVSDDAEFIFCSVRCKKEFDT